MDWMLTAGAQARRQTQHWPVWPYRPAHPGPGRLTAALEMAVLEGKLVRNVAKLVTPQNTRAGNARREARPRSGGFSPRPPRTGYTQPGGYRCMACAAARSCAGSRWHDSRYATLTLMEHAGVPIFIISTWAGHYDPAFTQKTYVHASGDDLHQGRAALAKIRKTGRGKNPQGESA